MIESDNNAPVIVTECFANSVASVWAAITEPEQMRQWFFEQMEAFVPQLGFETCFVVENEGRVFPHRWKITDVKAEQKITYNWKYDGYQGDSLVSFRLTADGDQTCLTLTHQVVEEFQEGIPEFTRESCLAGWTWFISQRLKAYMSGLNK